MIKTLSILFVLMVSTMILQSADNCAATERMRQQDLRKMQDEQLKNRNKRTEKQDPKCDRQKEPYGSRRRGN